MAQENYVEGCSRQRPPFLEPNEFYFWKSRFKTYIKFKDIDLWQVIKNDDFYYEVEDSEIKLMKETPYELLEDNQKKKLCKNDEAKKTLYNVLPHKEYERVFMCKTAKEVWHTSIITHQGNSQVKNCKIDLLTHEYEKFSISNEETIDSGFTRFNAIVIAIEEAKDLATLPLDELVDNLKVYEMILENDEVVSKTTTKDKVKSLALKYKVTREKTSDGSNNQDGSDEDIDEEEEEAEAFNLLARNFRKFFRKGNRFGRCNQFEIVANRIEGHFTSECRKPKENKAFIRGAWGDSEDIDEHQNDATCLMAIDSREDGGHVVFGSNLKGKVVDGGNITHGSITITNFEHVSGLAFNLISVGQLCDDACIVSFTKVYCDISKNVKFLAKGNRRNGLYSCKLGDNSKQQICLASMMDNSTLWHRRLDHANTRLIQNLASNKILKNLPKLRFKRYFYDTCGFGSQEKISRDVLTIESTMMIPLLYRREYSQWVERFMNYLKEQMDEEEMINCIKNGDQPLPRVTQVSIAGTSSTEQPPLKDKSMCKKIAKDLWDALARHMLGFEYGKQDRKAVVLVETICNNDKTEQEFMDINIDALYNILKQNQGDVNDAMGLKKKTVVVTFDPLALIAEKTKSANKKQEFVKSNGKKVEKKDDKKKRDMSKVKCYNCKKERHFAKDCKKVKVKGYEYYKTKMLLAKKDKDEQVLLAKDQAWIESSRDSDQEINANMVFMAQIEKVLSDSEVSTTSVDDKIFEIADQEVLYDKMSVQLLEMDKHVRDLKNTVLEKDFKISELEECVRNKDLEIEKCLKRLNVCENKLHKMGRTNQAVHMIMPAKDKMYNGRKGIGFKNLSYFCKAKYLRPTLYDKRVINLGNLNASYVNEKINFLDDYFQEIINQDFDKIDYPFQQTSSLKPYVPTVILEKIIIDLEDEVVSLLEKEKVNLETIESLKSKGFESSDNVISESENQSENDCQVVEKECDSVENSKVIAPGMFKLSVSQSVSPISVTKMSCASNGVESKLKRKRRKRKSSKQLDKQVNKDVLRDNKVFVHFSNLDTLSSVRRPTPSSVMWMRKGSSNTVKANFAFDCNNARNALCNARMNASVDANDLFVFDDVSIRKSHVSKMPFRKKPGASLNVPSRSKLNKTLPRIMRKWLPKLQPLAEPILQICLWIIDSGCSKHMTGNQALLTNFVEKFIGTVCFGNNDFAVIAGYGDVVIGSMTIKKVYYVEGLGHNLFGIGKFCNKGLEVAFRKSTCFVQTEDGVDLLTGDRSSNLYTIALNKVASNSSTCLLAKASFSQSWLWHQHHLCSACEQGKIHQKHHKSKTDFASNKQLYLLDMDLCGPMRVEKVFHKSFESFQEESSSSSLNDDVHQSVEEVVVPSSNTQSISNNIILNVDEASTSHNVFNEHLEDAYFDASTSFHNPSNVHTFYQPYPHEKNWTKDHPLHKISGDLKSSVRTRGQLANSCLFSCLLSSIEHADVAEALRDADWVSAMQEELDQFTRLRVWRLDLQPEGKTIIKTKWIFENKKDESSLVIQNKARLVAVGYSQQEDIDYYETFPPVARIEAIRLFLAYAAHKDFTRFGMESCDTVPNPMVEQAKLKLDLVGKPVDHTDYQSMIGSLMGLAFILEIAPLFLGFESGDKDDSLCLPKMPSITIYSIFAYGKLKSLTNQSLNCVLNAFDFLPIRVAFSLQDKDARRVDWSDKVDQEIRFMGHKINVSSIRFGYVIPNLNRENEDLSTKSVGESLHTFGYT
uniref:Integrase, catalytic region, zinc finger, CCHC-type, peptidase aspartic, catalytic n=1 Tax=Tanacetum cinerariifolium TaxID=118510 RepID=A0A6L2LMA7_TANCI|nr:integrase, catalytic region, zinc finger, CCHC-type, peptidase aspartic, catalytic [Tanacetum cinerariifolium]